MIALASGSAWGLCFGKDPLTIAPWFALVPLMLLLQLRGPFRLGFVHGFGCWITAVPWIVPTLVDYGQLPVWLAILGLIALASFLALYHALFAALGSRLWRRGGSSTLIGLPALWVAIEWLRVHLFSGFPWNLAGQSWVEVPGALPLSAWIGIYGISFLVVVSNVAVARSWARRDWRLAFASLSVVLILLALGGRWGQKGLSLDRSDPSSFRLLQPNFEIALEWDRAEVQHNYDELFHMTSEACDSPSSLVVWPESAGWPYSYSRDESFRQDVERFALERCPVLLNSSIQVEADDRNSVLLVTDSGVVGRYDKYHLVPFGEYVPLSGWLPFIRQIARNAGAFSAGENLDPLPWRGQQLAVAICYEITFPEEVAKRVALGGTILVTVTNDAWYGDSSAPWQHFQAARFRAAENGRYLVRAALTGVSAVVNPDGSLDQILEVGERGTLSATVPNVRGRTLFSRLPWLVPALSWVMCLSAILLTFKDRDR